MLAGHGRPTTPLAGWAVEPKFDGWRATVEVRDDVVRVWSRNGHDLTDKVPALGSLAGSRLILDGELICRDGTLSSFYGLLGALHQGRALFVAFDVLVVDDTPLVHLTYRARRATLETLDLPGVTVVPSYAGAQLDDVLAACAKGGMEGVVLKRLGSIYRPGQRSSDWRKVKCPAWREHLERRMASH
jgi:bifunctional non-homologous end joining protein LigD